MFSSYSRNILFIILTIVVSGGSMFAQTSGFTYQGRLTEGGTPANGNYDLQIALFDSAAGSTQIGQTQSISNVLVSAGVFTVTLDFGPDAFTGASRFLEISMRPSGAAAFTLLTPRQQITSTPYAVRSLNAVTAANAQQLGGVGANQYVKTDDARLSDARDPKTGSSNYVQNTSSPQAGTNFNISGNGTAGGTLSGNTVNAATQYNLGGQAVLGVSAQNVLKLGNTGNVGIGPTFSPFYKLEVETTGGLGGYGLRVGTGTGGKAVSIGGFGTFEVDADGVVAGRLIVQENGNVGIGATNPQVKLQVQGTVASTVNGFMFPDGSLQANAVGKVYTGSTLTEVEINRAGQTTSILSLTMPPGVYLITATVQFANRANDILSDNSRTVRCFFQNEFLGAYHLGAPNNPMDVMATTVHTVFTQTANGPVFFDCGTMDTGSKVFAGARRLTAIRVANNPN